MSKRLAEVFIILLVGAVLTALVEFFDRQRHHKATLKQLSEHLEESSHQLETTLNAIINVNQFFARLMNDNPNISTRMLESFAEDWRSKNPLIMSVTSSREYRVNFVYPLRGNERLVNLDYRFRPDQLAAIQLALTSNMTVVDAPVQLIQTGRAGVIIRSPFQLSAIQTLRGNSWGMATMTVDLNSLLIETGVLRPGLDFDIILRSKNEGQVSVDIYGHSRSLGKLYVSKEIELPNSRWELILSDTAGATYNDFRSGVIRSTGIILTLILVFVLIRYFPSSVRLGNQDSVPFIDSKVAFKGVMRLSLMIPFTMIIILSNVFSYKASMQSAEELKNAQMVELSAQLNQKIREFFLIPSTILIYNAEQFRLGLIHADNPDQMLQSFHLQLRQQPLLTFLSFGSINGEYFAASQPPMGDDRTVRIIEATLANDRLIKIYQADDLGQRNELLSLGNAHFDARTRPWFRTAIATDVVQWYPVYRYLIQDFDGHYDTLGMGMASVIRDEEQQAVGVITADVALSQVDEFLANHMSRLNGIAFIAENPSHELMASSSPEPTFFFSGEQTFRVTIAESGNPVIRAMGRVMHTDQGHEGSDLIQVNDERYLVDWQSIQLPNGPSLILGIALPESHLVSPARSVLLTNLILTLFLWGLMLLATMLLTRWFINPLHSISGWLKRVSVNDWDAKPPASSAFEELEDIRHSSSVLVKNLKQRVERLEGQLTEKNRLLDEANNQLTLLATTDLITGVANQQYFERVYSQEWSRVGRSHQPMTVMIIALDEYEQYVDLFGGQDADQALKQVAKVLSDTIRRTIDLVAYLSAGQFAIIAPNTQTENAMILAENILRGIEYQGIIHPESESGVFTACIGVGVYSGESSITAESFKASVEDALSQAQLEGKNHVVLADLGCVAP